MKTSRREFIGSATKLVAASALAGVALPHVHAAESNTIQLALIGCGGRGTGAVGNAFDSTGGPVKLVAMADVAEHKLKTSYDALHNYAARVDVPEERKFLGFDAYRKAMDCLHPGDVAVLTTHCAFRGLHLQYAIEKGLNVFMEKSFAPDPAGLKNILKLGEAAEKKDLKIGTGLMCRHSASRNALIQKIREGALGDIELIRAYRMEHGYHLGPQKAGAGELLRQISVPYYFMWAASGLFIELMIHQIDECCWIKDSWPVSAHGMGGRVYGNTDCSQNLDTYSIEFTFA
ncbi:MAG: Gfo/Idh/MocA family protein, partial [Limisphaerales bacterium]